MGPRDGVLDHRLSLMLGPSNDCGGNTNASRNLGAVIPQSTALGAHATARRVWPSLWRAGGGHWDIETS
eukprot:7389637-Alexandrium_andersonii.AAC.1